MDIRPNSYPSAKVQHLTCLLKDFQKRMQRSSNPPELVIQPLNLPFQLSFIGRMQLGMAVIPNLLRAALKHKRIIEEHRLYIYKQTKAQADFQLMLEESADMYAGLEFEYEKQKLDLGSLKYRIHKLIYSCSSMLGCVRALLQKERDLPELMVLLQSKDFLCVCEGIIVEAATDLLDSRLQHNTEPVSATILLLQRISELADGRKALIELEMDHNWENKNYRKTLIWALIVLFCKQSNCRQNIVMIMLAYTYSKEGARILISNQLDSILVSMVHSETDNSIKEISVDILCSLASLNDGLCLRNFRSSPEAAVEFIKTLKKEGSVKIKRMADYLAGKQILSLQFGRKLYARFCANYGLRAPLCLHREIFRISTNLRSTFVSCCLSSSPIDVLSE